MKVQESEFLIAEFVKFLNVTTEAIRKFFNNEVLNTEEQYYFNRFSYLAPNNIIGSGLALNIRKWLHVNGLDDNALEGMNFSYLVFEYVGNYTLPIFTFTYANFMNLNLAGSNFTGLDLDGSNFAFAKLNNADLFGVINYAVTFVNTDLTDSNITYSYFYGSNLEFANFDGVNFANVDFGYNSIYSTNFVNSTISPSMLLASNYNPNITQFNQAFKDEFEQLLVSNAKKLILSLPHDEELPALNKELNGAGTVIMEKQVEILEYQLQQLGSLHQQQDDMQ